MNNEELQGLLESDFPKEALSVDSSRGFELTSIKAQWIKERLNKVFSIFGWEFKENFQAGSTGILCHGELAVNIEDNQRIVYATGFSANKKNMGDSYKSAATDALSKCASYIGIGNEVFKGNVNPNSLKDGGTATVKKQQATGAVADKYPVYGFCITCDSPLRMSKNKDKLYCQNYKECATSPIKYDGREPTKITNAAEWRANKKEDSKKAVDSLYSDIPDFG
jgi:hypothetical protein